MSSTKYHTRVSGENLFFTSDTHFFHKNIIKFCERPFKDIEEMQEQLINNWNSVVPEDGTVYFLGDFAFGNSTNWKEVIEQLNGNIKFILGNHDLQNCRNLAHLETDRSKCIGHLEYLRIDEDKNHILLTHYPILTYPKDLWNFHGHLHSSTKHLPVTLCSTQYDVGVDNNNFRPVSYNDIKNIINKQIENQCLIN